MRRAGPSLLLVALLVFVVGASKKSAVIEGTSAPSKTQAWMDSTRKDVLNHSAELDQWLGPVVPVALGRTGTSITGALRTPTTGNVDSTTGRERGWVARGRYRIVGAAQLSTGSDSPNCSTYVLADQDTILKLAWKGVGKDTDIPPTADSSGTGHEWVGSVVDSDSVNVADGSVVSAYIKGNASTPDHPNNPLVWLYLVRVEDP